MGTTPYKLVFGHDAVLPIENYWNAMFNELNELEQDRLDALENIVRQKESMLCYYSS